MVAIVSGNDLGLSLSSLALLGQRGVGGNAAGGRNGELAYVNAANGNLILQDRDDHLASHGFALDWVRTYNSQGNFGDGGDDWNFGSNRNRLQITGLVYTAGSTVTRTQDDGTRTVFTYDASRGLYVNGDGAGAQDTISYDSAAGRLVFKDGASGSRASYEVGGLGRLLSRTDTVGNTVSYSYGSNGLLSKIVDASGETVYLDYTGNNLTQVRTALQSGATVTNVHYAYDAQNRLASVSVDLNPGAAGSASYVTTYGYDGASDRIASIHQSDGSTQSFTYVQVGAGYRVASTTDGNGLTTRFAYDTANGRTSVTDPLGLVTTYGYDTQGRLTQLTGPAVGGTSQSTTFTYGTGGHVTRIVDAAGHAIAMQYDANGNQIGQQDGAGNTIARTFDAFNAIATETVYAAAASGSTPAAQPLTTRYVRDAQNLLRFVVSPEGRVTEYRYTPTGERAASIVYAGGAYAVSGLGVSDVPTLAQMQAWAASADPVQTQRTDFTYDVRGQLASRTTYASVDASGNGVADGTQAVTRFVYDPSGRLLSTLDARSHTTQFTYDGLGRVLTSTDALGNVSVTQYDDANDKTVVKFANGLTAVSAYDRDGRLLAIVNTDAAAHQLGQTTYAYDADGRLRMTQDPTGVRQYVLYDAAGRKIADIDGTGALTEYRYDGANDVTQTIVYHTPLAASALASLVDANGNPSSVDLAALRPAASPSDAVSRSIYDAAGRLVLHIDPAGDVTRTVYDAASRVVSVIRYATPLDLATLGANPTVSAATPASSPLDRVTRNFYDADGLLVGTLDGEGGLVAFRYDAAGRQVERIAYATPVANVSDGATLASLIPAASAGDVHTYTLYDGRGQAVGTVDGAGYLTESVFDAAGNVTRTIRYATAVTMQPGATLAALRPVSSPEDHVTSNAYDELNRLASSTDAQGTATTYAYDNAGHLVSTTRAAGTDDRRTLDKQYDLLGRLTGELSAQGASLLADGMTSDQIAAIWAQYGTTYSYDAAGRRTSATDALGNKTLFFYDADGRLTHTIDALGEVQERQYDTSGRLSATVRYGTRIALPGLAGGLQSPALTAALAAVRNPALDSRVSYTYGANGLLASTTDALGFTSTDSYDAFGDLTGTTSAIDATHSLSRTYAYDRRGLQTGSVSDAQGINATTSTQYDAFGRVIRSIDANGNATTQSYDRLGRVIQSIDPAHQSVSTTYDAFDRVLTKTDASGTVTYKYDTAGRSMTVTTAEGVSVTTVRTRNGQSASVTDGLGNVTSYSYDKNGNLLSTQTPLTRTTSQYDAADRLIRSTDANGNVVAYSYDAANRLLARVVDPDGLKLTTTYQYDAKGQQVQSTDPNGTVTQIRYDANGRKLSETVDPNGLNLVTQYSYDAAGRTLTVTSPSGAVTLYVYNAMGWRVQTHVDANGLNLVTSTGHDKAGNAVCVTDPNGNVTRYVYDADGRVTYKIDAAGTVTSTTYDGAGRIASQTSYATPISLNGLSVSPSAADVSSRVTANAAADVTHYSRYDRDGHLLWSVDGMGDVIGYAYDANGNVVKRTAYANRLTGPAFAAVQAGQAVQPPAADPAHDQTTYTAYDALGRAVYVVDATGAVVEQHYDGNGHVIERLAYATPIDLSKPMTVQGIAAQLPQAAAGAALYTRSVYDKAGRLAYNVDGVGAVKQSVYDADGNVVRTVAYATALDTQALRTADPSKLAASADDRVTTFAYDAAGRQVFAVDALGGVTRQIFDANGNIVERIAYANPLTTTGLAGPATLAAIQSAVTADAANDRATRFVFDAANRQVMTIDALGSVTQNQYDGAGNIVQTRAYAVRIDLTHLPQIAKAADVSALLHADAANDRTTNFAFDAANRQVFSVDPLGYVKQTGYDGVGRIVRSTQYGTALGAGVSRASASTIAAGLTANAALDRTDTFAYDGAGNLVSSIDAQRALELFSYNGLGQKIAYTNKKGAVWNYDYDAAGRLVQETGPAVHVATIATAADGSLTVDESQSGAVRLSTRMTYDALGRLTARTEAFGRPEARTTQYQYDALGRQVATIYMPVAVYAPDGDNLTTNGATGVAARSETQVSVVQSIAYNVFGDAVKSWETPTGATHYKSYDKLGRLAYDVDPMGYVTGYTRNAFGDATTLTRYASAVALGGATTPMLSSATIASALSAAGVNHQADRALTMQYDQLGRTVQVVEPTAYTYDSSAASGAQYFTAGKTTRTEYNAFGQVVRTSVLRNARTNVWDATTQYYDQRGLQVAVVDAMGNLTTSAYDAVGNVLAQTEYATALAQGAWALGTYGTPAASANDRTTQYAYDLMNRKVAETRVNVAYSDTTDGNSVRGNLTTTYGYDALGNRTRVTDAGGASTYTFYDALGRTMSVAAPARVGADGTTVTPLTDFRRDAFGNIVVQVDYARGAATASETAVTLVGTSVADRISYTRYDAHGNVVQTTDAGHVNHYASFDADGHLVKQWQAVTGNDGVTHTLFEAFQYDKDGHQTDIIDPASTASQQGGSIATLSQAQAGVVDTHVTYDAFGDAVAKSVNGVQTEYSDYDAAGRVWRTNSGDGIDKVMLYDLQGRATATIASSGAAMGNVSLRDYASPDQVAQNGAARRTDTVYDALGHVIQQITPQRTDDTGAVSVFSMSGHASIGSSAGALINSSAGPMNESGSPGLNEAGHVTGWSGTNQVSLSWTALNALGPGDVKVHVEYVTATAAIGFDESGHPNAWQPGVAASRDALYSGDAAARASAGVTLSWQDPANAANGGVAKVTRVTVYKKDVGGNWQLVLDQGATPPSDAIQVQAPSDPMTQVQVQVAAAGTNNWFALSTTNFGDALLASTSGIPSGAYQYRVLSTRVDHSTTVVANGSLNIGAPTLAPIGEPTDFGAAGAGRFAWKTPGAGVDQIVRYRLHGTSNWNTLPVFSAGNGYDAVDTSGLPGGTYDYEVLWSHTGDSSPYAHATGQWGITDPVPPRYVPPVNLPNIGGVSVGTGNVGGTVTGYTESGAPIYATTESGQIVGLKQSTVIQWPQAALAGQIRFQYRPVGASAWTSMNVYTYTSGANESGATTGTQCVDIAALGPGQYQYQIFVVNGSGAPISQATGNLTVNAQGAGHYETRSVQVQVPVTVTPPPASNYITGYTRATYAPPVVVAYDESGNPTLGAHYQWQGSVVVAVPYTVTQITGYTTQTYPVQVAVRGDPVMTTDESGNQVPARDESGNIIYTTKYVTQYQTRQVPVYGNVTVSPPDPNQYMRTAPAPIYGSPVVVAYDESGNPILGAHYQRQGNTIVAVPYTVMQTQTQQQQFWVAGTTPPPSIASTTPPYSPGYTVPGQPKGYGASVTTSSNPQALSIGGRDSLSAASYASAQRPVINRTVDRWGNVLTISDPRSGGWVTTYRYNANNQVVEQDQPDATGNPGAGPVQRVTYDRMGRQVAQIDANGHVNAKRYDAAGDVTAELHADGGYVRHGYDAFGDEVQLIDALGNVTSYGYDNLARLLTTTHGVVGVYTVDGGNTLQQVATRNLVESAGYDQAGRKLWSSNGSGEVIHYDYDLRGNVTATTQPLGQVTRDAYDAQGHKIAEVDADGSLATWRYDAFGLLLAHTDIGGANYSYTYDSARQLIAKSNTRGQSVGYQYDGAGQLTQVYDAALGQTTNYAYNAAGQRVLERTTQGGIVYQDSHLSYDALGRLRDVADSRVHLSIDYDNVGNRLHEHTHVLNAQDATRDSDLWYAYDSMNRQTVVDGTSPQGGMVQGQGHLIGYDLNGNRTSDTTIGARITQGGGNSIVAGYTVVGTGQVLRDESGQPVLNVSTDAQGRTYYGFDESGRPIYVNPINSTAPITYSSSVGQTTEQYTYDAVGRISRIYRDGTLVDTRYYDGAGRMVQSGPNGALSMDYVKLLGGSSTPGVQTVVNRFDANGRLLHERVLKADGSADHETNYDSYDAVGNLLQYRYFNQTGTSYTNTYTTTLTKFEGYKESRVDGTSTLLRPGSTTDSYDADGNLVAVTDSTQPANNRSFVNDVSGHVLMRNQGGNEQFFVFANDQQVGTTGFGINEQNPSTNGNPNFAEVEDFNVGYRTIDANYPQASVGSYRVGAGDTLESIAQTAYGDNQLWYLIADANNLHGNADLKVGQTITIPTTAAGVHNDGKTFKPYNPAKAVGDTTPNLAAPPAHGGGGGCGVIGMIIATVVAVVATVFTAGALAAPAGAALSTIMATGASVMVGGAGLSVAAIGEAMIGAAVGSVVSQGVSIAMGMQSGFNWKGVALSSLSAGITAGVAGGASMILKATSIPGLAVQGAIGAAASQGVGVVTGLQHSFNWVQVAGAAAGAAAGGLAAQGLQGSALMTAVGGDSSVGGRALSQFAQRLTGDTAQQVIEHGRVDVQQVASDSFGNAIGAAIVAEGMGTEQERQVERATAAATVSTRVGVSGGAVLFGPLGNAGGAATVGGVYNPFGTAFLPSMQGVGTSAGSAGESDLEATRAQRIAQMQAEAGREAGVASAAAGVSSATGGNATPSSVPRPIAPTPLVGELVPNPSNGAMSYPIPDPYAGITTTPIPSDAELAAQRAPLSTASAPQESVGLVGEFMQRMGGAVIGVGQFAMGAARFVNDQGWVVANGLTAGWLAEHNSYASDAVARETAFGESLARAPGYLMSLVSGAGDVTPGKAFNDLFHSDEISRLTAAHDYAGAEALMMRNALGGASLLLGGEGAIADLAQSGRFAASVFGESATGQYVAGKLDTLQAHPFLGARSYVVPPNMKVWPTIEAVPEVVAEPLATESVGEVPLSATQLRNSPGVATVSSELLRASGRWLDAGVPAPIPAQVGDALAGQSFKTFGDLRQAIWEQIGTNPELNSGFSRANLAKMGDGLAPSAPAEYWADSGAFGTSFNIHHINPIEVGGAVYDLSNLQVVSPKVHFNIHYGPN